MNLHTGTVSGSAEGTGSFGNVHTDTIQPHGSSLKIKEYITLATDNSGNDIGLSAAGQGDGNYYVDFYNYQGGDPYIRLATSSGQGRPYIHFKNASYSGVTFGLNSGYNAENFVLLSGSNADGHGQIKDTVFRVESKIHGQTPTQTKMRSGRDIKFFGDMVKYDTSGYPFFSVESNFDQKIISGSGESTASFGSFPVSSYKTNVRAKARRISFKFVHQDASPMEVYGFGMEFREKRP